MKQDCFSMLLLMQLSLCGAAKVPAIIVFGDSSVDSGNNNYIPTIAKGNFAPYGRDFLNGKPTGRFSNGRLATDFISEAFGLPSTVPAYLNPSMGIQHFAEGVCFASAGTGFDNATADVESVIPLWKELEYFKDYRRRLKSFQGEKKASEILREALYIVSLGTNDFLENYYTVPGGRSSQFTLKEYENFLIGIAEGFITDIYQLGARKVDLTGLPPMGCLPLERAISLMSCNEDYNGVARDFNGRLQGLANKLNKKLQGIRIVYASVYDAFLDLIERPLSYGFEEAAMGCCGTGLFEMGFMCSSNNPFTCNDANKYVFWDAFHPTEKAYRILADHLMSTTLAIFK